MLRRLKIMLGIALNDVDLDDKLNLILESVQSRLKILLGGVEIPLEMEHIVIEVSIIRFNRIGSEGMSSHSVEGESNAYTDNDFAGFMDEIQAYLDMQKEARRGRVRFI